MTWYAWAILGLLAVGAAANVLMIGKPRTPITPATALVVAVVNGLIAWGVIALAGN